jgi:hypothetical protein
MALRLDPRIPLLWRSPSTVQFGLDSPVLVLDDVDAATERMLAALGVGVSGSGLRLIATESGADAAAADRLAERLEPVLASRAEVRRRTVVVHGSGSLADRVTGLLDDVDVVRTTDVASAERTPCDFAVLALDWVVTPELMGLWLRRDVPHLVVVASDTSVTVGPVVVPGAGPCLYCRHRWLADEDSAWPSIAIQLATAAPPVPGAAVVVEAAALAARVASGAVNLARSSVTIDAATGERRERLWHAHRLCECGSEVATHGVATTGRESGSAIVSALELPRRRTTTARPVGELA